MLAKVTGGELYTSDSVHILQSRMDSELKLRSDTQGRKPSVHLRPVKVCSCRKGWFLVKYTPMRSSFVLNTCLTFPFLLLKPANSFIQALLGE